MITEATRKKFSQVTLYLAFTGFVNLILNFFQINIITILIPLLFVITYALMIWFSFTLLQFSKEEDSRDLKLTTIILFNGSLLSGVASTFIVLINSSLIESSYAIEVSIYSVCLLGSLLLIYAFYRLKVMFDGFVKDRRNLLRGQTSLLISFVLLAISLVILIIIPSDSLYLPSGDLNPEYGWFFLVDSLLNNFFVVMFVLGFWNMRRVFILLDRIPKDFWEKRMGTQQAQRSTFGLFNRSAQNQPPYHQPLIVDKEKIVDVESESINTTKKREFCVKCGLEFDDDSVFCGNCGERNPYR